MKRIIVFAFLMLISYNVYSVHVITQPSNYGPSYAIVNTHNVYITCFLRDEYSYYEFTIAPNSYSRYYFLRGAFKWHCW